MSRMSRSTLTLAVLTGLLYGCETTRDAGSVVGSTSQQSAAMSCEANQTASQRPVNLPWDSETTATAIDVRPAAMIDGRTVSWSELKPMLNEKAGAEILQEFALDRLLGELIRQRGITIGSDEIAAERRLMQEMLDPDNANRAVRLLNELRTRSGLGPHRFDALLRRNASLRALVRERVQLTEAAVRQMFDAVHGPRRQVRLITLPSLSEVKDAVERVKQGEPFGDVAVDVSTDASAPRGGLLEPISRSDPSYPDSFRRVVWNLEPSEVSSPLLLNEQYAVLQVVRETEGDEVAFDDVRADMERRVQLAQERMHMDQLARALISEASITIFDQALRESWEVNRNRGESWTIR